MKKTAYELRISDWSSDVCSSDLKGGVVGLGDRRLETVDADDLQQRPEQFDIGALGHGGDVDDAGGQKGAPLDRARHVADYLAAVRHQDQKAFGQAVGRLIVKSEEHTSELQSLMRISYAVFCLKKKK